MFLIFNQTRSNTNVYGCILEILVKWKSGKGKKTNQARE